MTAYTFSYYDWLHFDSVNRIWKTIFSIIFHIMSYYTIYCFIMTYYGFCDSVISHNMKIIIGHTGNMKNDKKEILL